MCLFPALWPQSTGPKRFRRLPAELFSDYQQIRGATGRPNNLAIGLKNATPLKSLAHRGQKIGVGLGLGELLDQKLHGLDLGELA